MIHSQFDREEIKSMDYRVPYFQTWSRYSFTSSTWFGSPCTYDYAEKNQQLTLSCFVFASCARLDCLVATNNLAKRNVPRRNKAVLTQQQKKSRMQLVLLIAAYILHRWLGKNRA